MPTLVEQFEERDQQYRALTGSGEALSAEQLAQAETLIADMEGIRSQIESQSALQSRAASLQAWQNSAVLPVPHATANGNGAVTMTPTGRERQDDFVIPATAYRSRVTSFQDDKRFTAQEKAYRFGRFVAATIGGNRGSQQWCLSHNIPLVRMQGDQAVNLVHVEEINSQGGLAGRL